MYTKQTLMRNDLAHSFYTNSPHNTHTHISQNEVIPLLREDSQARGNSNHQTAMVYRGE